VRLAEQLVDFQELPVQDVEGAAERGVRELQVDRRDEVQLGSLELADRHLGLPQLLGGDRLRGGALPSVGAHLAARYPRIRVQTVNEIGATSSGGGGQHEVEHGVRLGHAETGRHLVNGHVLELEFRPDAGPAWHDGRREAAGQGAAPGLPARGRQGNLVATAGPIGDLPHALARREELGRRLAGRRLAVFLDYDGTLAPIVDRPEDAVLSPRMRAAVRALAARCRVCVVTGRDRREMDQLLAMPDLVVAASHGLDIAGPSGVGMAVDRGAVPAELLAAVAGRLREATAGVAGAVVEPKRASVAVHYRAVAPRDRPAVRRAVDAVLAEHSGRLRLMPGKMVYELRTAVDWDKGCAVLHLLRALGLEGDDVTAVYLGDDVTDEDAFTALGTGAVRVVVGLPDDPERVAAATAADYVLSGPADVEEFLGVLAGWAAGRP
jgi:trehalose 6-phosphate phosphatase